MEGAEMKKLAMLLVVGFGLMLTGCPSEAPKTKTTDKSKTEKKVTEEKKTTEEKPKDEPPAAPRRRPRSRTAVRRNHKKGEGRLFAGTFPFLFSCADSCLAGGPGTLWACRFPHAAGKPAR